MNNYTGAELIIRLLERQGISQISGIPGGANLPMYDALGRSGGIRHILARHEQGAGFIAQGQARSTGKTSVFFATSGPGATNALTAMADAKLDSIPVICITGQVPQHLIGTDAFQEFDTFGMSLTAAKHSYFVRSAAELLTVIPDAFRVAASGRPGPVWIDVPKDVQNERIQVSEWPEPGKADAKPAFDLKAIEAAAALIASAKRPIVYIGGGAIHSGASAAALALAEKLNSPTVMTLMGLGAMPIRHPLSMGMLGMHGATYTNHALEECDTLIALGARFDDRATGRVAQFCPDARIVHIDIDACELNKIKAAHASVAADLGEALAALEPLVAPRPADAWNDRIAGLKSEYPVERPEEDDCRSPYGLIMKAAEYAAGEVFVTTDVGQHQMRVAQAYPFERPRQLLTSAGLGTMGFGLPAAIGVALERPDATTLCFSGDGSLLMNIQELATAVEENLNVKIILANNNALGLVVQQQDLFFGERVFASNYSHAPDFVGIARAFGMEAFDLGQCEDPEAAYRAALRTPGPVLINVPIEAGKHVFPMVPPGAANREMLTSAKR